jgi:L-rhamnose mutarotase
MPAAFRHRVCLQLQIKPNRIEDYKKAHEAVWPDMLKALKRAGWHNYSIFLRPDGLLILYFETPSLEKALGEIARAEVNSRWAVAMDGMFLPQGNATDEVGFVHLAQIFNLEDQLDALGL